MKFVMRRKILSPESLVIFFFAVVSTLSALNYFFKLDLFISRNVQTINSAVFSSVMWFVTSVGNQPYMILIVAFSSFLLYINKLKREAVISSIAAAGSAISGSLIKLLVDHPRPIPSQVRVSVWLSDKSYPSNHVLVFTVFFGFLLYLLLKSPKHKFKGVILSIIFFLLIASIGISRIYLGAHWASDVLGGYLLGILWLIFTIRLYNAK
jgi:membrane-associated phospholipid phosphatase